MTQRFARVLFIFRRDLRLADNTGLNQATLDARQVDLCFIFDPVQVHNNPYRSEASIEFLVNSLKELARQAEGIGGRLNIFWGRPAQLLPKLAQDLNIQAVYCNKDYTPFSRERDKAIQTSLAAVNCEFLSFDDALLSTPGAVLKDDGTPYTVYTPFLRKARTYAISKPNYLVLKNLSSVAITTQSSDEIFEKLKLCRLGRLPVSGGRVEALAILEKLSGLKDYQDSRDIPALSSTSYLSAHNKFGTVSIREVYGRVSGLFGSGHTLINELYWRDFFCHIAFHFPHVYRGAFHQKYDRIEWNDEPERFRCWAQGVTGFPIVDAGMRELNSTGFMHNRVRMIAASFLVKDLHTSYRTGERYFANRLADYDPSVNNGNWQWAASTGCDAQPYFRIFNPWLQQQKFDADCIYIKRWIPELEQLSPQIIHGLISSRPPRLDYPPPIVEHAFEKDVAIERYRAVRDYTGHP